MTLPGVKSTLQCKLALVLLCLSSSTCYGQTDEESIPSLEISSKEEIHDQSLGSYDYLIEEESTEITEMEAAPEIAPLISSPIPETTSPTLLSVLDPIPTLPVSIEDLVPAEKSLMPSDDSSLHLFGENLPKPYLSISTKTAEAIPSFIPEKKLVSELKKPSQPSKKINVSNATSIRHVDLIQVFAAAPWIYSILAILLIYAFSLGFYNLNSIRKSLKCNDSLLKFIIPKIEQHEFDEVILQCEKDFRLLPRLIATSVGCRTWGLPAMLDHMKSEGRRYTQTIWHRIGLLSDVAMIAPLLGLLGTVIGMFYAFNDVSRSANSLLQFMDGLGVSIGTTVAGLLVAISAICFQTICRDRLARAVVKVEQNAMDIARLVDRKSGM